MRPFLAAALVTGAVAFRSALERKPEVEEPPKAVTCLAGDTKEDGCLSMCRRLGMTTSGNGQCDDFVEKLKEKGYQKFFAKSEPSLEPIVKVLETNCQDDEFVFFLEILLKFLDKVPEPIRDRKYAPELPNLKEDIVKALKQKDPKYEVDLASCQEGDTQIQGCRSVCRWMGLTQSSTNGQCDDYVQKLEEEGYKKKYAWKIWGHESSMEPILELLITNCRKDELKFYLAGIVQLIDRMPAKKKKKYEDELKELEDQVAEQLAGEVVSGSLDDDTEDDDAPLPTCDKDMVIEAGDIISWENYGPDFGAASEMIKQSKEEMFEHKLHYVRFESRMNYSNTFNTSTDTQWSNRTFKSKAKRLLVLSAKHCGNAFFKVGKAFADAGIFAFTGIGDLLVNFGKLMGRGLWWSGEKATRLYANVRQTTPHTDPAVRFTHTEMGTGKNVLTAAGMTVQEYDLCWGEQPSREGHLIISRFVGDGTVDAAKYRQLAVERAVLWTPYLSHYVDTVGQWYRAVLGKCINTMGTPGSRDYFEAVTPRAVKEMWNYNPYYDDGEKGFYDAVMDSFRTHHVWEGRRERVKPKAMFCSKFVSAVWSSTIGNPTNQRNATPRSRDLKIMLPFNPGACSPWSIVQWLVSKAGRKSWKSCIADLGEGKYNPCKKSVAVSANESLA